VIVVTNGGRHALANFIATGYVRRCSAPPRHVPRVHRVAEAAFCVMFGVDGIAYGRLSCSKRCVSCRSLADENPPIPVL
jgi:hypothetical protein